MTSILLLHPGEMGASIGGVLVSAGHKVDWVADGRSVMTRNRAKAEKLRSQPSLSVALEQAEIVMSICPPKSALEVAQRVSQLGFNGTFADCNAVSPTIACEISSLFGSAMVDGGIVGAPPRVEGTTRLYLSGARASRVSSLFANTIVKTRVVSDEVGAASALKMCYAGYTKGSAALLLALRAAAQHYRVFDMLVKEWNDSLPNLAERSVRSALGSSRKAWRFESEMREIASTLATAGLPAGFHHAAAEIYSRLARFKNQESVTVEEIETALLGLGR